MYDGLEGITMHLFEVLLTLCLLVVHATFSIPVGNEGVASEGATVIREGGKVASEGVTVTSEGAKVASVGVPSEDVPSEVMAVEAEEEEDYEYELPEGTPGPLIVPPDTPRFVVTLPDDNLLCFAIYGYELFTYNIISSNYLVVNAFLNISENESGEWTRGFTDIGFLIKVLDKRVKSGVRLLKSSFDSRKKKAILSGFGEVDMHNGAITFAIEEGHSNIESEESEHEQFRVILDKPVVDVRAISADGKFFNIYVDDNTGLGTIETHGLVGQFLHPRVRIDTHTQQLILPERDPVPVEQRTVWESIPETEFANRPCWFAKEGESVLEGMAYDYIVEYILATSYKFSQYKKS